jgi:hypothetical protein
MLSHDAALQPPNQAKIACYFTATDWVAARRAVFKFCRCQSGGDSFMLTKHG